jgi:large subunit ribosomal protein L20
MPRVKRGTVRREHRKKLAKLTKGYFLNKSKLYRYMQEAADRAGRFAYRDRRRRKRDFRRLWIVRIGAAARLNQLTYSQFIHGLKKLGVALDRKVLAEMAVRDQAGFAELAGKVKRTVESQQSTVES